jgi:hypothetical protein
MRNGSSNKKNKKTDILRMNMSKMKPINGILDINIAIRENKEVGIGV